MQSFVILTICDVLLLFMTIVAVEILRRRSCRPITFALLITLAWTHMQLFYWIVSPHHLVELPLHWQIVALDVCEAICPEHVWNDYIEKIEQYEELQNAKPSGVQL
ncbi:MAG: hypothetical protein IT422_16705 [Pirellulaceae bacterium]|nr:hypothetical protein [Pirellulaceae bacterium]